MHPSIPITTALLIAGKVVANDPIVAPGPVSGHSHSTRDLGNTNDMVFTPTPMEVEKRKDNMDAQPARLHARGFKNANEFGPLFGPFAPVRRDTPTPAGRGGGYMAVDPTPAGRGGGYQGSPAPSAG